MTHEGYLTYRALLAVTADGWPASVRTVCDAVGIRSSSTVHEHLLDLEREGFARRHPRQSAGGWLPTPGRAQRVEVQL